TQHNTTSCEAILVLNSKTNLLFLLVSILSFIFLYNNNSYIKCSKFSYHNLSNYSEIQNNYIYNSLINNNLKIILSHFNRKKHSFLMNVSFSFKIDHKCFCQVYC
ncbi:MAG: hypothetical protein IJK61_05835, partial [Bacteroidetes bacterium]|nr:hypothetical protein [Bacteroidota bacterium]